MRLPVSRFTVAGLSPVSTPICRREIGPCSINASIIAVRLTFDTVLVVAVTLFRVTTVSP